MNSPRHIHRSSSLQSGRPTPTPSRGRAGVPRPPLSRIARLQTRARAWGITDSPAVIVAALALVAVLTACGKPTETIVPPTLTATAGTVDESTHPASPGGEALAPETEAGTTVIVAVQENAIGIQRTGVPPGPAVFVVTNAGKQDHGFAVEGEGGAARLPSSLAPEATETLSMILRPGTYRVFCPVLNHAELGEQTELTIPAP